MIKYWAVSTHSLDGQLILGIKSQVVFAGIGFAIFAVGVEVAGITVSKVIYKWFQGKELALAMGLEMATARMGTALALSTSVPIAKALGHTDVSRQSWFVSSCCVSDCYLSSCTPLWTRNWMHRNILMNLLILNEFKLKDIVDIIRNKGWWYIAILCVFVYSAVFPFLKYASDLMVNKFGVEESLAGTIPALLPFRNILLTPLFGSIYDQR